MRHGTARMCEGLQMSYWEAGNLFHREEERSLQGLSRELATAVTRKVGGGVLQKANQQINKKNPQWFHNTLFREDGSLASLPLPLLACDPRSESQLLRLQWIWDLTTGCVPELIIGWNLFNPLSLLFLRYSALMSASNSQRSVSGFDSRTLNSHI